VVGCVQREWLIGSDCVSSKLAAREGSFSGLDGGVGCSSSDLWIGDGTTVTTLMLHKLLADGTGELVASLGDCKQEGESEGDEGSCFLDHSEEGLRVALRV